MVKRISCHTSETVFGKHFLKLDTKILRSKRDTGEKLDTFYSIMLLQAVHIMGKEGDQQKIHSKTILQRNFANKNCSASVVMATKNTTQQTPCGIGTLGSTCNIVMLSKK